MINHYIRFISTSKAVDRDHISVNLVLLFPVFHKSAAMFGLLLLLLSFTSTMNLLPPPATMQAVL